MDRMKMMSRDVVGGNVRKIAALFPQCVTERLDKDGKPELAIDFDKLRAELSDEIFSGGGGTLPVHLARQAGCFTPCQRAHHNDAPPRPCVVG